jgi:hypothetical protein
MTRKTLHLIIACLLLSAAGLGTDMTEWYAFNPSSTPEAGEIGLQSWHDAPAGKYGRVTRVDDKLIYNNEPIKLWGLNLCYANCLPDKARADARAKFYPKFGINSVRLHKYAESAYMSAGSAAEFDPQAIDLMDYQIAKFKEAGIFVKLSVHFGTTILGPDDVRDVPYANEFGNFATGKRGKIKAPASAMFYSPELQTLTIRQMVNLMKHKNNYTGLSYAEDPAIAFVEIVNEQSVMFFTSMNPLKQSPSIRKIAGKRFGDWLKAKYKDQAGLEKAWGKEAFNSFATEIPEAVDESLEKENILPIGNPWYWSPGNLNGTQAFRRQRLLDTLEFLHSIQSEAYLRYVKEVREAGYAGEFVGSNWQAGEAYSHYANLHTDYLVGMIDRHNYFGGGGNRGSALNNASMLARPGSGMLSSGMQQVIDRPFMLSEWIHVFANEWGAEGPAIIGAYGMGLNGWDVSYMFQNGDGANFSARVGRDRWDVTAPQVLGVFPAVARQVRRGDVKQSDVTVVRKVHVPSIFEGKLGFSESVKQGYDDKELSGVQAPAEALAAVRSVVAFTPEYEETPALDMSKYMKDGAIVSATGQLTWMGGAEKTSGWFTINSEGTKAVVGFADGKSFDLGQVSIVPTGRFAAIYVTAQSKDKTIDTDNKLVIVAMARARNEGMNLNDDETKLLSPGEPNKIVLEPVKATITLKRPGNPKVIVLDQDGLRTDKTLPVQDGVFTIDGARDKTPYYLVEY